MLREVPLSNVGVIPLKLCEEFVSIRESAVWFADAGDAVDYEFA
jgi:hypothetical protein